MECKGLIRQKKYFCTLLPGIHRLIKKLKLIRNKNTPQMTQKMIICRLKHYTAPLRMFLIDFVLEVSNSNIGLSKL